MRALLVGCAFAALLSAPAFAQGGGGVVSVPAVPITAACDSVSSLCINLTNSAATTFSVSKAGAVVGSALTLSGLAGGGALCATVSNTGVIAAGSCTAASGITVGGTAVASGTNGDLLGITSGGLLADTGFQMVTPAGGAYTSGQYLKFPLVTTSAGNDLIWGRPGTYVPHGHLFAAVWQANISEAAAGSTAFVGTDGSNTPVLGVPGGASGDGGLHMAVLGSSVDAECDEGVVIGHLATCASTAANSVVIGAAKNTGSAADILIGAVTDTGGTSSNIGIGTAGGFDAGSGDSIRLGARTCARQAHTGTIEIGHAGCASAQGHGVFGGDLVTDAYVGTESATAQIHAAAIVSHGTAPLLNGGTCTGTFGVGGATVFTFSASGACSSGTYIIQIRGNAVAPNGVACVVQDRTTGAATFRQTAAATNTATITTTGVLNADVMQAQCQLY